MRTPRAVSAVARSLNLSTSTQRSRQSPSHGISPVEAHTNPSQLQSGLQPPSALRYLRSLGLASTAPFWYHCGMAMTLRLPAEIEDQIKQAAESEHRSVQQTVLLAIEEYLSARETAEILADPAALRSLAEAMESEQTGDVVYGVEAARALLAERKR
jgi:hypothetical protein